MNRKLLSVLKELEISGEHITCALSGGADSVALLHGLLAVREELHITVSAAHFNHCLRGEESDGDEAFVRDLCKKRNVPLTVGRGDPKALTGKSPEEAARQLRYEFLLSQPGLIATAHHSDDQVETVLLNLLRGTGLKGLCGIPPKQGRLIRPLLTVSREEILSYVQEQGLSYRTDRTNAEDDALRNRLRHHVVPLLQKENPNLTDTVCRMTQLLRQDEAYLQQETDALLEKAFRENGYHCPTLLEAPAVLRHRAIRQLLTGPKPSMAQVEAVEQLLARQNGSARADLQGGILARRTYDLLSFTCENEPCTFEPVELQPDRPVYFAPPVPLCETDRPRGVHRTCG